MLFFYPLHHAGVETGARSEVGIGAKRSQHVRLCFKQTKFAGTFLARYEVRVKRLRNLLGGTLQIFLKVIPDWLMHDFFPQKLLVKTHYGSIVRLNYQQPRAYNMISCITSQFHMYARTHSR